MPRLTTLICTFAVAAFATSAALGAAHAESYPERPVKIVVPYPAGSGLDTMARVLGQKLSERWRQSVVVENKAGANTIVGADTVAKAAPDGYTILMTSDTTVTANPELYTKLPYSVSDFEPVTQLVQLNQMLLTRNDTGVTTLAEAVKLFKAHPDKYNYASYGAGSQPHLAMETFKNKADVSVLHVPYNGLSSALNALLAGEVQFTFIGVASSLPHIKAGTIVPLAIGGEKRVSLVPDVPTFAELGYADVPAYAWFGVLVPKGTDSKIINKIANDIREVAADPEFQQDQVKTRGYDAIFNTPEEFASAIMKDRERAAQAVKLSGAKLD